MVDYYKPKEFIAKEQAEEMGVAFKQMFHGMMMTAMAQGMADFNQNPRGRGRGRGSRGGHGGYGSGHNQRSGHGYSNQAPGGAGYGKQKPNSYGSYGYDASANNPRLPTAAPIGVPPMGGVMGGSLPPAPSGLPPTGVLPSGPPPIGGMPNVGPAPQLPPPMQDSTWVLNPADLEGMGDEEKRTHIGEVIYPMIEEKYSDNAPRITGMLIDMEEPALLTTVASKDTLLEKAKEAYDLLVESGNVES